MKKTKIVCTLGPASRSEEALSAMIDAGMDVARLNFSHGDHDGHRATYELLRSLSARKGREIAILQDLQGPKIRVGVLDGGVMKLVTGATVMIAPGNNQTESTVIPTTYAGLAGDVRPGDTILMDDGLLRLRVVESEGQRVRCHVEVGGELKTRKGINLPGVKVSAPALTDKDLRDLEFGAALGVDFVCLSFVRGPEDVELARTKLEALGTSIPLIAKIEKPEVVERLDAILDCTDGIMVARGDLGVEMGPEKVPLIQKRCIEEANLRGKLVITATQMLESMVDASFPTRAEASDVANAVLDQSDAVMLSAETATGAHPALVIRTMARIIEEIESSDRYRRAAELPPLKIGATANALAHAAAAAANTLPAVKAVVCISREGIASSLLSDYRPRVPIFALISDPRGCHRAAAFWGVTPMPFSPSEPTEETIARAEAILLKRGLVKAGDAVVMTLAVPPNVGQPTNTLNVHRINPDDATRGDSA